MAAKGNARSLPGALPAGSRPSGSSVQHKAGYRPNTGGSGPVMPLNGNATRGGSTTVNSQPTGR